jgi:hypothetical protein
MIYGWMKFQLKSSFHFLFRRQISHHSLCRWCECVDTGVDTGSDASVSTQQMRLCCSYRISLILVYVIHLSSVWMKSCLLFFVVLKWTVEQIKSELLIRISSIDDENDLENETNEPDSLPLASDVTNPVVWVYLNPLFNPLIKGATAAL